MSTDMTWQTSSTSSADTEKLGELLGSRLRGGEVIELHSDLGGGKTTFVRGLAKGAGSRDRVASPTFTLSKVYNAGKLQIHHFDFYRLSEAGIMSEQLSEALDDPSIVTVVEWADIVQDVLPAQRFSIEFEPVAADPDERKVAITYPESKAGLIAQIETSWQASRP